MKKQLTFIDVLAAHDSLKEKLVNKNFDRNKLWIAGVPRGGLFLAQYLSYYYGLPKGRIVLANSAADLQIIPKDAQIIVADDIYDSGKQYKLFECDLDITYAVLFARLRFSVDDLPSNVVFGYGVKHDNYVYFPWDI